MTSAASEAVLCLFLFQITTQAYILFGLKTSWLFIDISNVIMLLLLYETILVMTFLNYSITICVCCFWQAERSMICLHSYCNLEKLLSYISTCENLIDNMYCWCNPSETTFKCVFLAGMAIITRGKLYDGCVCEQPCVWTQPIRRRAIWCCIIMSVWAHVCSQNPIPTLWYCVWKWK